MSQETRFWLWKISEAESGVVMAVPDSLRRDEVSGFVVPTLSQEVRKDVAAA